MMNRCGCELADRAVSCAPNINLQVRRLLLCRLHTTRVGQERGQRRVTNLTHAIFRLASSVQRRGAKPSSLCDTTEAMQKVSTASLQAQCHPPSDWRLSSKGHGNREGVADRFAVAPGSQRSCGSCQWCCTPCADVDNRSQRGSSSLPLVGSLLSVGKVCRDERMGLRERRNVDKIHHPAKSVTRRRWRPGRQPTPFCLGRPSPQPTRSPCGTSVLRGGQS
jgi:hypothetical protein